MPTAAQVGAVNKNGDIMTGALVTPGFTVLANHDYPGMSLAGNSRLLPRIEWSSNFANKQTYFIHRHDPNDENIYEVFDLPNATTSGQNWYSILTTKTVTDYVVAQGTSGIWTNRKWNSGIAECWGNYDAGNPVAGANVRTVTLPFNFTGSYIVNITPAKTGAHSHTHADCDNNTYAVNHSAGSFIFRYTYDYASLYAGSFNLHVLGKWK